MATSCKYLFLVCLWAFSLTNFKSQTMRLYGKITDSKTNLGIQGALVQLLNSNYNTVSDKNGNYQLSFPKKQHISLVAKHISYKTSVKELDLPENKDSLFITVSLKEKEFILDSVTIKARNKPDTLVYSGRFSIYDYDFYEDNFILLTAEKNLNKAELKLATYNGRIINSCKIPTGSGASKELVHDYMGFTNLICENAVYRIVIYNNSIVTFSLKPEDFNAFVKPIIDTVNGKLIFSDYYKEYPMFNYFSYDEQLKQQDKITTISNADLLKLYNMEYYYLKPRDRLNAMAIADEYKIDKKVAAALMTGFTKSMFYDPLYAPLFILKDTISVFDHYKDMLFHFDKYGKKLDSTAISYNHPKNWREWKRLMLKDDIENTIYAVYEKNGHKHIKGIDYHNGQEKGKYKLIFHSADKLKVRDGYIYYVYRPFDSTQEKFLYREKINLNIKD